MQAHCVTGVTAAPGALALLDVSVLHVQDYVSSSFEFDGIAGRETVGGPRLRAHAVGLTEPGPGAGQVNLSVKSRLPVPLFVRGGTIAVDGAPYALSFSPALGVCLSAFDPRAGEDPPEVSSWRACAHRTAAASSRAFPPPPRKAQHCCWALAFERRQPSGGSLGRGVRGQVRVRR